MKLRVIHCEDESHDLSWVLAKDCPHWSMDCPRSKKAKKAKHKLRTRGEPGFTVAVTGIDYDGWDYDYDPPEASLALVERRYEGHWCPGPIFPRHRRCGVRTSDRTDAVGQGGVFVPAGSGALIECATGCGLLGAA